MDLFLVDVRAQSSTTHPFQAGLIHQSDGVIFRDKVLPEGTTFGDLGDSGPILKDVEVEP